MISNHSILINGVVVCQDVASVVIGYLRTTGTRTLADGSKVEETFCNICRDEVRKILRDDYFVKDTKFEGIVEQQMFYGVVTPQKNPVY